MKDACAGSGAVEIDRRRGRRGSERSAIDGGSERPRAELGLGNDLQMTAL